MSARKLGRLVGLVFVLAAVFGGVSVTHDLVAHGGASSVAALTEALLETVWS